MIDFLPTLLTLVGAFMMIIAPVVDEHSEHVAFFLFSNMSRKLFFLPRDDFAVDILDVLNREPGANNDEDTATVQKRSNGGAHSH